MNCKFCGVENPENAVFCKDCGKRIDGLTVCPSCGALTPEGGTFCTNCGIRLDGKTACTVCGTVYEGKYCPNCGTATESEQTEQTEQTANENAMWKRVLWHVGSGFGLLTAVCALIFTFFIGCTVGGSQHALDTIEELGLQNSVNLFYYFGEMYDEISLSLRAMATYSAFFEIAIYSVAVLSTIIAACILIAVPVMSILTIVRYVSCYVGKTQKQMGTLAFATFFTYLAGATLILACNAAKVKMLSGSTTATAYISYNGATIAGISLCAIFVTIGLICLIARRGKELITKKNIVTLSFSAITIAFLSVIVAMCAKPSVAIDIYPSLTKKESITISMGLLGLAQMFPALKTTSSGNSEAPFAYAYLAFIMVIALTVLSVIIMTKLLGNTVKEQQKTGLGLSIAALVVVILCTVFAILAVNEFASVFDIDPVSTELLVEPSYTGVIVLCVFSALNLFATIAHFIGIRIIKKQS